MSTPPGADLFEVAATPEGVTVVRFTRRTILDPVVIEAVGERLLGLVREQGAKRLVLNFARVESMTSAMVGQLVALYQAVEADGGKLVFCSVEAFLRQIFTICHIPDAVPMATDEAEAVRQVSA